MEWLRWVADLVAFAEDLSERCEIFLHPFALGSATGLNFPRLEE
jgi:hypothetical protein